MKLYLSLILIALSSRAYSQHQWTQRVLPSFSFSPAAVGRLGLYLATGEDKLLRSNDGVTWSTTQQDNAALMVAGQSRIVGVVGEFMSQPPGIWSTDDGIAFTQRFVLPDHGSLNLLAHNGAENWVACTGTGRVYYSQDNAVTWFEALSPAGNLRTLAFGGGLFLATDGSRSIMSSSNGRDWQVHPQTDVSLLGPMVFYNGRFHTAYAQSSDGSNWAARTPAAFLAAGNELIASDGQTVITRWTGSAWQQLSTLPLVGDSLSTLAYCGDLWIARSQGGKLLTSPVPSRPAPSAPQVTIQPALELRWLGIAGHTYQVEQSSDGNTWANASPPIVGSGSSLTFTSPSDAGRKLFRVVVR